MILDEIGKNHFFMKIFKNWTGQHFGEDQKNVEMWWNSNFNRITDSESSNISLVGRIKKLRTAAWMQDQFLETVTSRTNFRWRVKNTSLAIPCQNQEECFAPFDLKQTKTIRNIKKLKNNREHDLTCLSVHFLGQILSCSFFYGFHDFRKLNSIRNHIF